MAFYAFTVLSFLLAIFWTATSIIYVIENPTNQDILIVLAIIPISLLTVINNVVGLVLMKFKRGVCIIASLSVLIAILQSILGIMYFVGIGKKYIEDFKQGCYNRLPEAIIYGLLFLPGICQILIAIAEYIVVGNNFEGKNMRL